jgi:NADH:ubiquinone reductase (H+-translocating)
MIGQPDIEFRSTLNLVAIMSAMPVDDRREDTVSAPAAKSPRPRIVIVGGGFAGIAAARALRRADAEIILIDQRNHHIFQPLLYQVATAVLSPAEIAAPIRQLEAKQRNLRVVLAEATRVDLNSRTIDANGSGVGALKFPFDYLVFAAGMRPSYFGHDDFAQHAPGLKNLNDAETVRAKILSAFELAEETDEESERLRQMTFVLVGGGATGVELAASMAHMITVTFRGNFRRIDPAKSKIILLEGGDRILPTFAETLSKKATKRLEKLGISVRTGIKVERVDGEGVVADGQRIPAATVLWTAGVAASPIAKTLGAKTDRAGRVIVDPSLNVPNIPDVFVVGDAASITHKGRPVPGVAQAAIQQGRFAGRIVQRINGRHPKRAFKYFDKGTMAVVGKNFAVLETRYLRTSGFLTWLAWAFIHVLTLPQLQNRLRVQNQWLWSYFTGQRSSRLIPEAPRVLRDQ